MAAISHTQKIGSTAGNGASSINVSGTTTTGHDIIVAVVWYTSSGSYPTCAVTDQASNSYSTLASFTGSSTTGPSYLIVQAHNTTGLSSQQVIATFTGTAPFSVIIADEWVGLSATQDGSTATNSGNNTTMGLSALTTTNANDLILGVSTCFGNLVAPTWPLGWAGNEWQSSAPSVGVNWRIANGYIDSPAATVTISTTEHWNTAVIGIKGADTAPTLYRLGNQDASGGNTNAGTVTVSYPNATTANHLLIAAITCLTTGQDPSISTAGWTKATSGGGTGSNSPRGAIYYKVADGTETSVAATNSGVNAFGMGLAIFEYAGTATASVTDGTAASNSSNVTSETSWTTPNITTTNANDLIFYVVNKGTLALVTASWSTSLWFGGQLGTSALEVLCGQNIVSSTQTNYNDTLTWTTSSQTVSAQIAAFKASSGVVATPKSSTLMMMGIS
jgi:hypothetical protein